MEENKKIIHIVRDLIDTCRDGEKDFSEAAVHFNKPELRQMCEQSSRQRAGFAEQLKIKLAGLGDFSEEQGHAAGTFERGWIDIEESMGAGEQTIFNWLEAREDDAIKHYQEALNGSLPADIASLIRQHLQAIVASHDRIKMLRDQAKAA